MLTRLLFCCCIGFLMCLGHVTFTNLQCNYKNRSLGPFEQCQIKAVNRTHKYITIKAKLYLPVADNVTMKFKVLRKDNVYKPFYLDLSFDACKFLKKPFNPIIILFFNTFKDTSNINHTCPYNHDLIIDKVWTGNLENDFARYLPIPNGEYAIITSIYAFNIEWSNIKIHLRVTN